MEYDAVAQGEMRVISYFHHAQTAIPSTS
jgi:hypothetical protein